MLAMTDPVGHSGASTNGAGSSLPKAGRQAAKTTKLSDAEIVDLADKMNVPVGLLQMVLRHYPELAEPLARWRRLSA